MGRNVASLKPAELVCDGCGEQVEGAELGDLCWCAWAQRQAKIVLNERRDERSDQALGRSSRRVGANADQHTPRGRNV